MLAPFMNVTVPLGVPLPGAAGLTRAVNVTDCPQTEGLADELTTVMLPSGLIVSVKAAEVLRAKKSSPVLTAVSEWVPKDSVFRVKTAWPAARNWNPKLVSPSIKLTVPLGVPGLELAGFTLAVKVTVCP